MNKQQRIDELERTLKIEQDGIHSLQRQYDQLQNRFSQMSAENELLRKDKDWLKQMHSAVLQSMHAFVSGRRT